MIRSNSKDTSERDRLDQYASQHAAVINEVRRAVDASVDPDGRAVDEIAEAVCAEWNSAASR